MEVPKEKIVVAEANKPIESSIVKPIEKFKDGAFEVAIWRNKFNHSITLSRSFLNKDETWNKQSVSVIQKDITRLIFLLGEGYRCILGQKKSNPPKK